MKRANRLIALCLISCTESLTSHTPAIALPPPEDKPEEVLRAEIITGARSPIDGRPLTAAEYAQLQTELQTAPPSDPQLSPKVKRTVNLLRLRRFIKTVFPFIPIR